MLADLHVDGWLTIPGSDLEFTAVRASGPGGQHVNKTSTKVVLRFDLNGSHALNPGAKARLRLIAGNRFDKDGWLVVTSQHSRYQPRNLADARDKLAEMISRALRPPKRRVATKPSKGVARRRVKDKRKRAETKRLRRSVHSE